MAGTQAPTPQSARRLQLRRRRDFTLLITNAGKLLGLVLGVLEAVGPAPNKLSLLFFGFLFLGAQRVEDMLVSVIDRTLGGMKE